MAHRQNPVGPSAGESKDATVIRMNVAMLLKKTAPGKSP